MKLFNGSEKKSKAYYCNALQGRSDYNICINSDLTVSCNCQDYDGAGRIGDLKYQTFSDIYYGEIANRFREKLLDGIFPISVCEGCAELHQLNEKDLPLIRDVSIPKNGIMIENTVQCNLKCLSCQRDTLLKNTLN